MESQMSLVHKDLMDVSLEPDHNGISSLEETQLWDLRRKLQDDIRRNMADEKGDMLFRRSILLYNEVIDALREFETRIDPMERLPGEIISGIILEVCKSDHEHWKPQINIGDLLILTMVSKKWQQFILSEPLLWNFIPLYNCDDMHAILALQLKLSRDLPLTLEIFLPWDKCNTINPELSGHQPRIETIILHRRLIKDNPSLFQREKDDFQKVLNDIGRLPNLRCLGHSSVRQGAELLDIKDILYRFPSVEEMNNVRFTAHDLRHVKDASNMRTLTTFEDPRIILPIVQNFTNLHSALFLGIRDPASPETVQIKEPRSAPPTNSTDSLGWKVFANLKYIDAISTSFLSRLSSLVILNASMSLKGVYDLMGIIHKLTALNQIVLNVYIRFTDRIMPQATAPLNKNVRLLNLRIHIEAFNESRQESDEIKKELLKNAGKIPLIFLQTMPNLNFLAVSTWNVSQPIPFSSFDGSFKGNRLQLWFVNCLFIVPRKISIPSSVQILWLRCHIGVFCSLLSTSVKHLVYAIDPIDGSHETTAKDGELDRINLGLWPSLETIRVDNELTVPWSSFSLQFLRKVTIWSVDPEGNVNNGSTAFVKDIACHPESYPSLEDIDLMRFPEWDILLIMLERRNLLASPSVKRINKLRITEPYPPKLRAILGALLRCQWPERPPNKEISLAGNAEIILDLSLSGCYVCHRRFHPCRSRVKTNQRTKRDPERRSILEQLQQYPESDDEVLATWATRATLWDTLNKDGGGRLLYCSYRGGMPIDGYTWE